MIVNKKNIETWLAKEDYFRFSKLLEITENPLSITLGYLAENEVDGYNRVRITPIGVKNWNYKPTKKFFPSESTGIEQIELDEGIGDILNLD